MTAPAAPGTDDTALRRQVEQYRVLYALTETLMASPDVADMYEAAMDGFGGALGVKRVSILLSEGDGIPRFKAWRRLSERYRQAVEGHTFWPPDEPNPAPVAVGDVATDPAMAAFRDVALAEGIAALVAMPLVVRSRTIGKCMLYFDQPRLLSPDEMRLAHTVADHVALAVERKRAEAEIRRSSALLQNASDITTVVDADGTIRYQSPAFYRMFRWAEADVLGRDAFGFIHPDDREATLAAFAEILRSGVESPPVAFRFRDADGNYVMLEGIGVSRLDDPIIGGVVVNSRDVTERNRLSEELRQAQKMEAIGRLAGGIAHDFNNLLTVIGGYTDAALEEHDAAQIRACLDEVKRASTRATQLTTQLLAFARRRVIAPSAVDLNAAIQLLAAMLQRLIGADVRLETALAPEVGFIRVDGGQLEQVVMNLAINARDAMPDGGVLTLATALDATQDVAVLTVRDTGRGMDRETVSHMFEPFFTTKGPGQGTGLGLATVYGIVTQHGGTIAVESTPGRGTVFTLTFPRDAAANAGSLKAPAAGYNTGGHETILLVEDEPMVRNLVRTMLVARGYSVLEAGSGEDALALDADALDRVQLLLTDMVMPGINGRVLAERLTAIRPALKVLFMSGYTEDAVLGSRGPGVAFLQKPFAPDTLRTMVRQVLDR